jgi:hypothetical protein
MISGLIDWHLRHARSESDLPDLPEVRRFARLSWWNGLTFGAVEDRVAAAREDARKACADELTRTDQA